MISPAGSPAYGGPPMDVRVEQSRELQVATTSGEFASALASNLFSSLTGTGFPSPAPVGPTNGAVSLPPPAPASPSLPQRALDFLPGGSLLKSVAGGQDAQLGAAWQMQRES